MDRNFEWLIERVIYVSVILAAFYFVGHILLDYHIL